MIKEIEIETFCCCRQHGIKDLKRFTIVVGRNGSAWGHPVNPF